MENASKALIMAGAVLIALIIVSLGVIVFRNMSGSVSRNANLTQEQIASFNDRITPYIGKNVSGSQVNALIQLARTITQKALNEGNDEQIFTINGYLTVDKNNKKVTSKNVKTGALYKVEAIASDTSALLTTITITPK